MGMRFKVSNIILPALLVIVACAFLLSAQVVAGSDGMSAKGDMSQSSSQQKMMDKKKDMDKTGQTMTEGSKKMMDTKKGMAKNEKTKKPMQTVKDEAKKMSGDMNKADKKTDMMKTK